MASTAGVHPAQPPTRLFLPSNHNLHTWVAPEVSIYLSMVPLSRYITDSPLFVRLEENVLASPYVCSLGTYVLLHSLSL